MVEVLRTLESQPCEPVFYVHVLIRKVKCMHMHTSSFPACLHLFVGFGYNNKTLARKIYRQKRQKRCEMGIFFFMF